MFVDLTEESDSEEVGKETGFISAKMNESIPSSGILSLTGTQKHKAQLRATGTVKVVYTICRAVTVATSFF